MNETLQQLTKRYKDALSDYLAGHAEKGFHAAYEVGRDAIAGGFGVLDMARIHHLAFASSLPVHASRKADGRWVAALETLFMEALSPFEVHHRGFREANERLRVLSSKMLHAQEEERRRISRELHDEVGQALTAIGINLQLLKQHSHRKGNGLATDISELQQLLMVTMEDVHRFSYELRPPMLDDLGLTAALRSYINAFSSRTGIKTRFDADLVAERMKEEPKTVFYRVAQESLTNIYKYAEATRVSVSLRRVPGAVCLTVRDDGRGFQPGMANGRTREKYKSGLGLIGMEERLRLVNGSFMVESAPGEGATVRATIPFEIVRMKVPKSKKRSTWNVLQTK